MGNSESKKRVYQVHGPNHDNVNAIESIFKFLPNVDYSTPSIPIPVAREIYRVITSPNNARTRQSGTAANAAMNVSAAMVIVIFLSIFWNLVILYFKTFQINTSLKR